MSSCDGRLDDAARYVSERMSDVETAAFEEHLLGCRRCQTDVKLSTALARGLAGHRVQSAPTLGIQRRRHFAFGTLALAAGLAFMVMQTTSRGDAYDKLGRVELQPPYGGVQVRSGENAGDSLFVAAMADYKNRDYTAAIAGLRAARHAGVDSTVTTFFLGVSALLAGDDRVARLELTAASAMSRGLYAAESHYYLAKLLLRDGKPKLALQHLAAAATSRSLVVAAARALADSVQEIGRR